MTRPPASVTNWPMPVRHGWRAGTASRTGLVKLARRGARAYGVLHRVIANGSASVDSSLTHRWTITRRPSRTSYSGWYLRETDDRDSAETQSGDQAVNVASARCPFGFAMSHAFGEGS
jgi:hypothetical protein